MKFILIIIYFTIAYNIFNDYGNCAEKESQHNDSFYIWQRAWDSSKIITAARKNKTCKYYFLAGEFTALKSDIITPSEEFYSLPNNLIPVFRIRNSFFKNWIEKPQKLTDKIIDEFYNLSKKSGKNFTELQIDLDCPESKLKYYAEFLQMLKKKLPENCGISFTALPCHLKNKKFKNVAKSADYFVLQVHGLEVPEKFSDKVSILNIQTANSAIDNAEKLSYPYIIALPSYAYQLNFDSRTKKFLFLNAEKIPPQNSKIISKIIAPDFKDLLSIIQRVRGNSLKFCRGIVWFRMPIVGDRYNLDLKTLNILRNGEIPSKKIVEHFVKNQNGTLKLIIENRGILEQGTVNIQIQWENTEGVYDLFAGFSRKDCNPGLPVSVQCKIPPPGKAVPVGWFRTFKTQKQPEINIKFMNSM